MRSHEDTLRDLLKAVGDLKDARYQDLRTGVSRESIDDLKQRLQDAKDSDRDMRQQLEQVRVATENLRTELARAVSMKLVGPVR